MKLRIRRWFNFVEHHVDHSHENAAPLRKVAVAAVVENPYAGQQVEDLRPMIAASEELGREMGKVLVERLVLTQFRAWQGWHCRACGRAGTCQCPPDELVGGGKAWISSFMKRAVPGVQIDVPLACKDALYVRSHYDGMTVVLPDAPWPDEIAVIFCVANRGRISARVGGLKFEDMKGEDGLL